MIILIIFRCFFPGWYFGAAATKDAMDPNWQHIVAMESVSQPQPPTHPFICCGTSMCIWWICFGSQGAQKEKWKVLPAPLRLHFQARSLKQNQVSWFVPCCFRSRCYRFTFVCRVFSPSSSCVWESTPRYPHCFCCSSSRPYNAVSLATMQNARLKSIEMSSNVGRMLGEEEEGGSELAVSKVHGTRIQKNQYSTWQRTLDAVLFARWLSRSAGQLFEHPSQGFFSPRPARSQAVPKTSSSREGSARGDRWEGCAAEGGGVGRGERQMSSLERQVGRC